jgi:predicted nucleic acid-binding protein
VADSIIHFFMDEHVPEAVTAALRRRGVDVLTTQEAGMSEATDSALLVTAASQGRVLFTQDADLLRLHAQNTEHAGIVYAPQQTPVGVLVRGLILIVQVLEPDDMRNDVEFL